MYHFNPILYFYVLMLGFMRFKILSVFFSVLLLYSFCVANWLQEIEDRRSTQKQRVIMDTTDFDRNTVNLIYQFEFENSNDFTRLNLNAIDFTNANLSNINISNSSLDWALMHNTTFGTDNFLQNIDFSRVKVLDPIMINEINNLVNRTTRRLEYKAHTYIDPIEILLTVPYHMIIVPSFAVALAVTPISALVLCGCVDYKTFVVRAFSGLGINLGVAGVSQSFFNFYENNKGTFYRRYLGTNPFVKPNFEIATQGVAIKYDDALKSTRNKAISEIYRLLFKSVE